MLTIFLFIFLLTIFLFASPKLSPIPYFPTNKKDIPKIIKVFLEKERSAVIDFGAGDGEIIFQAAKKAYEKKILTQFYAIEINPILIFILHLRRLFHPNKKNIYLVWSDMFKINLKNQLPKLPNIKNNLVVYLYISPWLINKLLNHLKTHFPSFKNITFISYFYPIKGLKKKEKVIKGINNIYVYY